MSAHELRKWINLTIAMIGYLAVVFAAFWLIWGPEGAALEHGAKIVLTALAYVVGIAWALIFAVRGFQASDEFVQQRSMVAWYWGGLFGIAASAPVFVFIRLGGLALIEDPSHDHYTRAEGHARLIIFTMGYLLAIAPQFIGFFAAGAWLRWGKR